MFDRNKRDTEPEITGPYLVESLSLRPEKLQAALNKRHAEGFDVIHMYSVNIAASAGMLGVVFKKRDYTQPPGG